MTDSVKLLFVIIATYLSFSANIDSKFLDTKKPEDGESDRERLYQCVLKIVASLAIYIILFINWRTS